MAGYAHLSYCVGCLASSRWCGLPSFLHCLLSLKQHDHLTIYKGLLVSQAVPSADVRDGVTCCRERDSVCWSHQ